MDRNNQNGLAVLLPDDDRMLRREPGEVVRSGMYLAPSLSVLDDTEEIAPLFVNEPAAMPRLDPSLPRLPANAAGGPRRSRLPMAPERVVVAVGMVALFGLPASWMTFLVISALFGAL